MKRLYALIVTAALCFLPTLASAAVASNSESHGIAVAHVAATDIELFQIKNARVLHSDQEVQETWWQSIQQVGISAGTSFQGPGDADSGWNGWYSCARAYNAAYATALGNACDLVDSAAPTVVICTLKFLATGFVDLASASCTGGVTPAVKCAAATGGTCNVSKAYDHLATVGDCTNTTAASQPRLTLSALNGLPSMTFTNAAASVLTCPSTTIAQPIAMSSVFLRTAGAAGLSMAIANASNALGIGHNSIGLNVNSITAGTQIDQAATDGAFHSLQGFFNGAAGAINTDGTDLAAQNAGANAFVAQAVRLGRSNAAVSADAQVMEAGVKGGATTPTTRGNLSTNQHSTANGYNF